MQNNVGIFFFVVWFIVCIGVCSGQKPIPEAIAKSIAKLRKTPLDMINAETRDSVHVCFGFTDGDWLAGSISILFISKASDRKAGEARFAIIGTEKMVSTGDFDTSKVCLFEASDELGQLFDFSNNQIMNLSRRRMLEKQAGSGRNVFFFVASNHDIQTEQYIFYDSNDRLPPKFRTLAEWVAQRCMGFPHEKLQSKVPKQLLSNGTSLTK